MANFFLDNKDLQYHLEHPLMRKIVELKERGFAEKDTYDYAPQNFEDAMDSYRKVLAIAGEVCGDVIAPNAESVDHEGPKVVNDHVVYAEGTQRNLDAVDKAGLGEEYFIEEVREAPQGLAAILAALNAQVEAHVEHTELFDLYDEYRHVRNALSQQGVLTYCPYVFSFE